MDVNVSNAVKTSQEQAIASWVTYLNQVRLNELIERLIQQDVNLEEALMELTELKEFIGDPSHILGGAASKHGEIAEHFQVNISNARNAVRGLEKEYTFDSVGRTAPEDYLKNGQQVQSKFYNGLSKTLFGPHALKEHLETYPDFLANGGSYDIPKDQYNEMIRLLDTLESDPHSLSKSEYSLAIKIKEYLEKNNIDVTKDIQPAVADYSAVQVAVAEESVEAEEEAILEEDAEQRESAYEKSKSSLKEGLKATGISAVVEGGISFCLSVAKKRKDKKFSEFDSDDWKEVGIDTGTGAVKGGIRGGAIYLATNFTATPANVASAYVTAIFGIIQQARELEKGSVSKEDFVINCETVCLDATVSAIASLAGEILIPIPVLGAVVGNVVGEIIYGIGKKYCGEKEQNLISTYRAEIEELNKQLDIQLLRVVTEITEKLRKFEDLERMAFDADVNSAFCYSAKLAIEVGVDAEKVLINKHDIDNFFLN